MTDHDDARIALGAYVLGALEPAERHAVEGHLRACTTCRDELSRLSVLPPLLERLSVDEATASHHDVQGEVGRSLAELSAAEHSRVRRQVRWWQAAAAALAMVAAVVALAAWQPWRQAPNRLVERVVATSEQGEDVRGTVAALAWEWGTTVEIEVEHLPPADAYEIWTVSRNGRRQKAGVWGPTAGSGARVRGASAIQRPNLVRVEVTSAGGAPLFEASFEDAAARDGHA